MGMCIQLARKAERGRSGQRYLAMVEQEETATGARPALSRIFRPFLYLCSLATFVNRLPRLVDFDLEFSGLHPSAAKSSVTAQYTLNPCCIPE